MSEREDGFRQIRDGEELSEPRGPSDDQVQQILNLPPSSERIFRKRADGTYPDFDENN